ncbi:vomeronasal type-2 receptor 26-like [Bombina bombina]|uniref:vomeronasal type-2 receptor 26-like n=1 Tax=Bombina bombina TaxID=8345 RepID=UPI00235AA424|nr:vomeronasal type-2 receptor 26-like [Bombina bombina]
MQYFYKLRDELQRISVLRAFVEFTLNNYLKKVHFKTPSEEEMFFDDEGNPPGRFDIINIIWLPNETMKQTEVGYFNQDARDTQFFINESAIQWSQFFPQVPVSVCSESCLPGYMKVQKEGKAKCCYSCIPCPDGEITNISDMGSCLPCPEDQWSNVKRDKCIPKSIDFLSYEEPLGLVIALLTAVFVAVTSIVLLIFIKHKDTPVVKANNLNLSYTLLLSLMISFLCPFLFIGQSTKISCLFRQVVFVNTFAVSVSCVLAKTTLVIFAFKATKPSSTFSIRFGKTVSSSVVFICSSGEVMICVVWLIFSPPYPYYNTQVEVGKIIVECNEGSTIAFYLVLGYMGFLSLLSFFVAFMARKLPDTFNEAQHITFSMLVFCSVWISFIPAYLSTKGKYMVAMEIFAILASGAGLLCCIFFPKCFIILIKPELNIKASLGNKRKGRKIQM